MGTDNSNVKLPVYSPNGTRESLPFPVTPGCLITLSSTYHLARFVLLHYRSLCMYPCHTPSRIRYRTQSNDTDEFDATLQIPQNSSINVTGIPPRRSRFFRSFRLKAFQLYEICQLRFFFCPFAPQLIQFGVTITLIEVPCRSTLSPHWRQNFESFRNN